MRHYDEDELVLYHYGEIGDRREIAAHLDECEACAAEYAALATTLELVDEVAVPSREADYGRAVWARVEPRLHGGRFAGLLGWLAGPRLALAGAVATLVLIAFLAGRWTGNGIGEPIPEPVRERILLVAIGDHLERSERLLTDLVNAEVRPQLDLGGQRQRARELVNGTRIYRTTASGSGQERIADLLDDLERLLLEVANGPETVSASEFLELRRRIESRGLLIKIEVLGRGARERGGLPVPQPTEI